MYFIKYQPDMKLDFTLTDEEKLEIRKGRGHTVYNIDSDELNSSTGYIGTDRDFALIISDSGIYAQSCDYDTIALFIDETLYVRSFSDTWGLYFNVHLINPEAIDASIKHHLIKRYRQSLKNYVNSTDAHENSHMQQFIRTGFNFTKIERLTETMFSRDNTYYKFNSDPVATRQDILQKFFTYRQYSADKIPQFDLRSPTFFDDFDDLSVEQKLVLCLKYKHLEGVSGLSIYFDKQTKSFYEYSYAQTGQMRIKKLTKFDHLF